MSEQEYQKFLEQVLPYLEAIVNVTRRAYGRNPDRMRALAGQIARNAIEDLRRPRSLTDKEKPT